MSNSIRNQTTLRNSATVPGFGFWSGRDVTVRFEPAPENTGIVFVRTDLPGHPEIPARVHHRVPGPRRTTLVHQGCSVELVEHVMAALAGLRIDNCRVLVDQQELPGCDGSCLDFVNALIAAGIERLSAPRLLTRVETPAQVGTDENWVRAEPVESDQLLLNYQLSYENPAIGQQTYSAIIEPENFANEIASARTFLLANEAEILQEKGLGQRVSYQNVLVFGDQGLIDNALRFANECARHKLLDMIGDLALLGTDIAGKLTGYRSGHHHNAKMVFALIEQKNTLIYRRRTA